VKFVGPILELLGFAGSRSKVEKGSWGMARYLIKSDPITGYRNDGSTLTSGQAKQAKLSP
jgi:hypothetical protein